MSRGSPSTPSQSERGSLLKTHHATVDLVLKELKISSRRLSTMTIALADETQVLDRLYYKNKNQHRSSLFSRRIIELRRYSHRTEDFEICALVNDLRQSFFGTMDGLHHRQMKGSWSHYPDQGYVSKIKERSSSFLSLLRKMHTISSEAFRYFSLAMQTGAFIQLFLTLIAITSRLTTVVAEMIEILQFVIPVMDRLLAIFQPTIIDDSDIIGSKASEKIVQSSHVVAKEFSSRPIQISTISRKERPPIVIERIRVGKRASTQIETSGGSPRKKKVKKNEIDAIFGF